MTDAATVWRHRTGEIRLDRTRVMGILNVTPDSFSDGGRYLDPEQALRHGLEMVEHGADVIDVGGESTRPGSDPVIADEEWRRVGPVIRDLAAKVDVPLSVDTMKPEVAAKAIKAGASIVNDVSGLRESAMVHIVARDRVGAVVMHMLGNPKTMQTHPKYADAVGEVRSFLTERIHVLEAAGVASDAVAVDPGVGFGKTKNTNSPSSSNWTKLSHSDILSSSASRGNRSSRDWAEGNPANAFPGVSRRRRSRWRKGPTWSESMMSATPSGPCGLPTPCFAVKSFNH